MTDSVHPEKGPNLITDGVEKGTQFFLISKNISNVTNTQYKNYFLMNKLNGKNISYSNVFSLLTVISIMGWFLKVPHPCTP